MNAGKSTALLQSNHNYIENGMETILFIPKADADKNDGYIESRIGLRAKAIIVDNDFNFYTYVKARANRCDWNRSARTGLAANETEPTRNVVFA